MKLNKNIWIAIVLANLAFVLFSYNKSIQAKETIIKDGQLILLELAPADPRSLMQGDYMVLDYAVNRKLRGLEIPKTGFCILKLDENGVGQFVRTQPEPTPVEADTYAIEYQKITGRANIGNASYFFQEGKGKQFDTAKYGGLRIDNAGNSVLIGLYDADRNIIEK